MKQLCRSLRMVALMGLLVSRAASGATAGIAVHDGDQIVFLGDSLTALGMQPAGYVSLVIAGLKTAGVNARAIGAGFPGNKSNDMLFRLQRHVIDRKPTWMTVSCGVNDVWFKEKGVTLDAYRENMTQIVDRTQAAGIRVMILTATMIGEDPLSPDNQRLSQYNEVLRNLAQTKKCLLADLNADMQRKLTELERAGQKRGHLLTSTGAHMNPEGDMMMATGVLRAFGVDEVTLSKAKEAWLDIPGGARVGASVPVTLRQLEALQAIATSKGQPLEAVLQPALESEITELIGH